MQLGVIYHISKGASKNGLPVKYTFKVFLKSMDSAIKAVLK